MRPPCLDKSNDSTVGHSKTEPKSRYHFLLAMALSNLTEDIKIYKSPLFVRIIKCTLQIRCVHLRYSLFSGLSLPASDAPKYY